MNGNVENTKSVPCFKEEQEFDL
jgi:hypothetical protein